MRTIVPGTTGEPSRGSEMHGGAALMSIATAHPHDRPIYGLMAEFDSADALSRRRTGARRPATSRSTPTRRIPIEEVCRRARPPPLELPLIVLIGGLCGMLGGYFLQYWVGGDRLPDQHRRPAAQQLAGVHRADLRVHHPRRGARRRCSACSRSTACRSPTTRCSTCRASRWRRATASSW